jgi:hypothetical protein
MSNFSCVFQCLCDSRNERLLIQHVCIYPCLINDQDREPLTVKSEFAKRFYFTGPILS